MVSVIIPVLNESKTIRQVIQYCQSFHFVAEVIVVDDQSTDNTVSIAKAAGARVLISKKRGKGLSMKEGLHIANGSIVVFLDGDIDPYPDQMLQKMVHPILTNQYDFIKAAFSRNGGRVTEILAKPLLSIFFPELTRYKQPLGGMIAGRKKLFEGMEFYNDYGVDIGILIDMYVKQARIAEIAIGHIENDSKPLYALGKMSTEVAKAILHKASKLYTDDYPFENIAVIQSIKKQIENVTYREIPE